MGETWVFDYGPVVMWGVSDEDGKRLCDDIKRYVETPTEQPESETMQFEIYDGELRIHNDKLYLNTGDFLARLAASHALAQSIKLNVFENIALKNIQESEYIPRSLARDGRIPLRRRELARLRGQLFSNRSDILLNFNLLDTPEFFWDYPDLEVVYRLVARYLEIEPRTNLLNKKLETMHELLEMLAAEHNHKHSAFLEWIIILLIAFEIVMYFFEKL